MIENVFTAVLITFNFTMLAGIILANYRIGRIEGSMKNGGYLKCPFYRGEIDKSVKHGKAHK